jgi:gliding motility-associated-like protein
VTVTVEPSCEISIPNVITPDGSGPITNEIFYIENLDKFPNSELKIYNRWGKKVFETTGYMNNWNGGNLNDGTYYYVLTVPASGQVMPKLKPSATYDINVKSETDKRAFAGYFQIIR